MTQNKSYVNKVFLPHTPLRMLNHPMTRKFTDTELIIASHNNGKVREIGELLAPYSLTITGASELNLLEPIEDADSFEGNAALKALAAAKATGKPALSDDSGLCIRALNDAPGIYSARWAGESKDFALAMQKIKDELQKTHLQREMSRKSNFPRTGSVSVDSTTCEPEAQEGLICRPFIEEEAYFVCVLALAWPDGHIEHFRGEIHGHLTFPPRGDKGFGYDPIFIPEGHTQTFAEMNPTDKHAMSHRAKAFEQLVQNIFVKN